ncbi:MAG: SPOR domain-containing protein [Dissulfurimicrobium sp.]|uniref:SPOR domain-containing protein n=1 Tax=Dissulfurimicrobium sp. TaxID=2022436 RepID=UPI00404A5FF5
MPGNSSCFKRCGAGILFHVFLLAVAVCCLLAGHPGFAFTNKEVPYVSAKAAVLMDAKTGEVLYSKNPHLKLPPASTTKIVTTLVALDHMKLKDMAVASSRAAMAEPSKLGLHPGDRMTINDLLYSIMLKSANDASVVVAEKTGGSVSRFVEMMNEKARELGAVNTHFSNPNGLPAPNHYTTAYDLALIFRKAEENPIFAKITKTRFASVRINSASGRSKRLYIQNHNKLLWTFDGTQGGKTGYTHAAMHCFTGMVSQNGRELVVSMLGSKDNWNDVIRLLDYGFGSSQKSVIEESKDIKPARYATMSRRGGHKKHIIIAKNYVKEPKIRKQCKTYMIQVAAFKTAVNAKRFEKILTRAGYNTTIKKNADNIYKVLIKEYGTPRKAEQIASMVENKYDVKPIVLNN